GRHPQRELGAGGVTEDRDAAEVEVVDGRQGDEMVDGPRRVLAGGRPATPRPDPAVLGVPGGDAPVGEVESEAVHQVALPGVVPEPAVEEDDDRVGAGSGREPEVALLAGPGTVGQRVGTLVAAAGEVTQAVAGG